jgi:hypothetical protein
MRLMWLYVKVKSRVVEIISIINIRLGGIFFIVYKNIDHVVLVFINELLLRLHLILLTVKQAHVILVQIIGALVDQTS